MISSPFSSTMVPLQLKSYKVNIYFIVYYFLESLKDLLVVEFRRDSLYGCNIFIGSSLLDTNI
jgi:hypothetical protein